MQPIALLVQQPARTACTEETFYAERGVDGDVRARTQEGQCRFRSVRATSFNLSTSAYMRTSWPVTLRFRLFAFDAVTSSVVLLCVAGGHNTVPRKGLLILILAHPRTSPRLAGETGGQATAACVGAGSMTGSFERRTSRSAA